MKKLLITLIIAALGFPGQGLYALQPQDTLRPLSSALSDQEIAGQKATEIVLAERKDLATIVDVHNEAWSNPRNEHLQLTEAQMRRLIERGVVYLLRVKGLTQPIRGVLHAYPINTAGNLEGIERGGLWDRMFSGRFEQAYTDTKILWAIGTIKRDDTKGMNLGQVFIGEAKEFFRDIPYIATFSPLAVFADFIKDLKAQGMPEAFIDEYGVYLYLVSLRKEGYVPYLSHVMEEGFITVPDFVQKVEEKLLGPVENFHVGRNSAVVAAVLPFKEGDTRPDSRSYTVMYGYRGFQSIYEDMAEELARIVSENGYHGDVTPTPKASSAGQATATLDMLFDIQRPEDEEAVITALEATKGNTEKAAKKLGKSRRTIEIWRELIEASAFSRKDMATIMRLAKAKISLPDYTEGTLVALEETNGNYGEAAKRLGITRPIVSHRVAFIKATASAIGDTDTVVRVEKAIIGLPEYTEDTIKALEETNGDKVEAAKRLKAMNVESPDEIGITVDSLIDRIVYITATAAFRNDIATLLRINAAKTPLPEYTKEVIDALKDNEGHQKRAAEDIGISDVTMSRMIRAIMIAAAIRGDRGTYKELTSVLRKDLSLPWYTMETIRALEQTNGRHKEAGQKLKEPVSGPTIGRRIRSILAAAIFLEETRTKEETDIISRLTRANTSLPDYTEETIAALEKANGRYEDAGEILGKDSSKVSKRIAYISAVAAVRNDRKMIDRLAKAKTSLPDYTEETIKALEKANGNHREAAGKLKNNITPSVVSHRVAFIKAAATVRGDQDTLMRVTKADITLPTHTEDTIKALEKAGGDQKKAAKRLGINRTRLNHRLIVILRAAYAGGRNEILSRLAKVSPQQDGKARPLYMPRLKVLRQIQASA